MEWEDHIGCVHDKKVIRRVQLSEYINKEKVKIKEVRDRKNKTTNVLYKKELIKKIDQMIGELKPYIEERSNLMKTKPKYTMCEKRKYRFIKSPKGVIPTILQNLLDARKQTRKQITQLKLELKTADVVESKNLKIRIDVLDKRQLAYKVSSNSMYGAMGVRRGYLPFMPGAMCTTYMGRKSIELVADVIPKKYGGKLIYGDTDSNYIHFPHLKTAEESWDYAEKVAEEVSKLFPSPMCLEFEQVIYWRFFILTKKRYMYTSCGRDGVVDKRIGKKGVLLARRDNSQLVRTIYEETITKIFNRENKENVLCGVLEYINKFCSNTLNVDDFVITKSVGDTNNMDIVPFDGDPEKVMIGNYKVPKLSTNEERRKHQFALKNCSNEETYYLRCLPAQVQLAEKMRRRGQRVDPGSRLEYVITDIGKNNTKQYEKIENSDYFIAHKDVLKIDFMAYLKLLMNPLDQILNVAYSNDKSSLDFVTKQYNIRNKHREKMLKELISYFQPQIKFTS
jgi:DNA polymerase elongation subunit (family B)